MPPSLSLTAVPFVVLFAIIIYFPMLATSLPIGVFQDRRVLNSSPADDKLVFDVAFPLGMPRDCAITTVVFYSI